MSVATQLFQPVRLADDKISDLIRIQSQYLQDPAFFQQNASADYDQLKKLDNVLFQLPEEAVGEAESLKLAALSVFEGPPPKLEWRTKDVYPPHALSLPKQDQHSPFAIFDPVRLLQTKQMLGDVDLSKTPLVPSRESIKSFDDLSRWYQKQYNDQHSWWPPKLENLYYAENIGLRKGYDWYTDAAFAQQFFTGTNPSTIKLATNEWISRFSSAANVPTSVSGLLQSDASSFYVVDYSFIRESMGASPSETLFNDAEGVRHYSSSPVVLFHLNDEGDLHPVAIIIDYKGGITESVTIFNQRLDSSDTDHDQSQDWPWRYAKMCVLSADWALHEMIIHLTHTHLIEEAIIIAARRTFDSEHIVYRLLSPHWDITLALNQLARELLVPNIISPLAGFSLPQTYKFIRTEFTNFDWKGKHIPTDLKNRGFPIDQLGNEKFHNYTYARDIIEMWKTLHHFVKSVLKKDYYPDDSKVAEDAQIQAFCAEMRSVEGAGMVNFPESVQTLDELVDLVTMAIHIASPQHTAINYLQQYYQTFVPNKPSALFTPLPDTIDALLQYKEDDVLDALPFGQNKLWLLSAQIPYLLTSEVGEKNNIITYATEASKDSDKAIMKAGGRLLTALGKLKLSFELHNLELDDHEKTPYNVLAPEKTASSIVI
ncbi:hypothetical protein ONZ45_g7011 [Pleurotus djamor]|nr:hypothetical protein ONZ45_g7011 [Pleurotus djamor]